MVPSTGKAFLDPLAPKTLESHFPFLERRSTKRLKNVALIIVGWFFVGLGIIGLFLPFLQGVLFIMIGLAILSSRSEAVRCLLAALERRFPGTHDRVMAWKERVLKWFSQDRSP
jgi:hypothetical protein